MHYEIKPAAQSTTELTITVSPEDYQKNLEKAAVRLSERAAIHGFRPGKAPYEAVKQQLGAVRILEEAMQSIVEHFYFEAISKEKLDTIGTPQITLQKFAPGNDLVFVAAVALLPTLSLPNLSAIKVDFKKTEITKKEVDAALENLRKMQPKETPKSGAAEKEDKVTIKLEMFLDGVPVEGGQAPNHQVYLNEPHYIPGLAEELVGLKKGDTKEFTLKFPKDHYQKHLANKSIDFKIEVNDVFQVEYSALNDEFAKALGQKDLPTLIELLTANLTKEAERKDDQRFEAALFENLVEKTTFTDIPEVVVNSEKNKMFYELKHSLDEQGISIEQYLKDLKKTEKEIFDDFAEGDIKRAKAALVAREVAKINQISVSKEEIDAEVKLIKATYPDDSAVQENVKRPEVLNTIATTLQNKKVVAFLKEKIVRPA